MIYTQPNWGDDDAIFCDEKEKEFKSKNDDILFSLMGLLFWSYFSCMYMNRYLLQQIVT